MNTAISINRELTTAHTHHLTPEMAAGAYGPTAIWSMIPNVTLAIKVLSPRSGIVHVVRYNPLRGVFVCSCPASGRCWHLLVFEAEWLSLFLPVIAAARPVLPAARPVLPERGTEAYRKQIAADFG